MIANYGYEDGSGFYYITIDGDACAVCGEHGCVTACPQKMLVVEMDDYDDRVAAVAEGARKRVRELCSECKAGGGGGGVQPALPCAEACSAGALRHSW